MNRDQSGEQVLLLIGGVASISGKGQVAVFGEGESPLVLEREDINGQDIELAPQQAGGAEASSIREDDIPSVAGIYLNLTAPSMLRSADAVRLERFRFENEFAAFVNDNAVSFLCSVVVVVLRDTGKFLPLQPQVLQFHFSKISENHASEARVLINHPSQFFDGDVPSLQYGFRHGGSALAEMKRE